MRSSVFGLWLMVVLFAFMTQVSQAATLRFSNGSGVKHKVFGANFSTALYEESVVDMEVAVMGGNASVTRYWREKDGGHWTFNPNWSDLTFEGDAIKRGHYEYEKVSDTVYAYKERKTITKTATGYRWSDTEGNWINYDEQGLSLNYGDRNNITFTFSRNAQGFISELKDHFNNIIYTFTYRDDTEFIETEQDARQLKTVTDYSGRKVQYIYEEGLLTEIIDVRGASWKYSYTAMLGSPYMSSKTDPLGHTTNVNHVVTAGGSACVGGSGGSWAFNESKYQWGFVGGTCSQSIITRSMVMYTGLSDSIGVISKNQYFYDAPRKNYIRTRFSGGVKTERTYSVRGSIKKFVVNSTDQTSYDISDDRRRRVYTDRNGNKTVFQYDGRENLIKVSYPDQTFRSWTYDRFSNVLSYLDENGVSDNFEYDSSGNLIRAVEAVGQPEERIREYERDEYGNVLLKRLVGDAATQESITQYEYDDYGNVIQLIDAEGNTFVMTHDVMGNVRTISDDDSDVVEYIYDAAGNLLTRIAPLQQRVTYEYDLSGNFIKSTDERNFVKTYEYNARNQLVKENYLNSETDIESVEYVYDNANRLIETKYPHDGGERRQYDNQGRLVKVTKADGQFFEIGYSGGNDGKNAIAKLPVKFKTESLETLLSYNKRGWPIKRSTVAQDESVTNYLRYDGVGNVIGETDPEGHSSSFVYDAFGNLTEEVTAGGDQFYYQYDRRGNLIKVFDAPGSVYHQYGYDRLDRLVSETDALQNTIQYAYDLDDNLISYVDEAGNLFEYQYDANNRLISEKSYFASDTQTPVSDITYTYNDSGVLTGWSSSTFSEIYNYDNQGRYTGKTFDFGVFTSGIGYTYRQDDLIKTFTAPDNTTYSYQYDVGGKLVSMVLPGSGTITVNSFKGNLPDQITYPGGMQRRFDYTGFLQVKQNTFLDAAGNSIESIAYSRNLDQQVTGITRGDQDRTLEYTEDHRLSALSTENSLSESGQQTQLQLEWDKLGNLSIAGEQWSYNALNQLESRPGYSYDYDSRGNLLSISSSGQIVRSFEYDPYNRLSKVFDELDQTIAEYAYDPFDRRIWKKTATSEIYFIYTPAGLAAEYDTQGNLIRSFGFLPYSEFSTDPVFLKQNGEYYFYHSNQIAAPISLVDRTGNVVWQAEYNGMGEATVLIDDVKNPLRNPGQYADDETGFYYNFRRYFDPSTSRYITKDPLGLAGGINQYAYADGDVVNAYDPTGEAAWLLPFAVGSGNLYCFARDFIPGYCTTLGGDIACAFVPGGRAGKALKGLGKKAKDVWDKIYCETGWNSFSGETQVHTQDGLKSIEDVQVGELVLSHAEWNGEQVYRKVEDVITGEKFYSLVVLTLSNGEEIEATPGHPFFVKDRQWVEAELLEVGDYISSTDGQFVRVSHIERDNRFGKVYNLSVEQTNTYYVGVEPVLVHNAKKSRCGIKIPNKDLLAPPKRRGEPPIGSDGHPVELHHRDQMPDGPLDEMTRTDHRLGDNYKKNHNNTGQEPSKVSPKQRKKDKKEHWNREFDDGRFKDLE